VFTTLLDLLFPIDCAGCGRPGRSLCAACGAVLAVPRAHRPDPCPPALPPIAVCADYAGPARSALLAYKERGRRDLTGPLAAALCASVRQLLAGTPVPHGPGPPRVWLIPVPSRRAAARARGGDHMLRLTRACVPALAAVGIRAGAAPWLRVGRRVRDSAGLSATGRAANVAGAFELSVRHRAGELAGGEATLVLLDDLVTTGSTVAEAVRALGCADLEVAAIAAIAGTARRPQSLLS
jgi:predicted amidophosphoribosyltransferase